MKKSILAWLLVFCFFNIYTEGEEQREEDYKKCISLVEKIKNGLLLEPEDHTNLKKFWHDKSYESYFTGIDSSTIIRMFPTAEYEEYIRKENKSALCELHKLASLMGLVFGAGVWVSFCDTTDYKTGLLTSGGFMGLFNVLVLLLRLTEPSNKVNMDMVVNINIRRALEV